MTKKLFMENLKPNPSSYYIVNHFLVQKVDEKSRLNLRPVTNYTLFYIKQSRCNKEPRGRLMLCPLWANFLCDSLKKIN